MNHRSPFHRAAGSRAASLAAMALSVLALWGCAASAPTRYYTLATPAPAVAGAASAASATDEASRAGAATLFIALTPVAVPERLARPQMVVLSASRSASGEQGQVRVLEEHLWASSFEQELRDALASGVAARLGAVDVSRGAAPAGQPVWRIAVQVGRFDAVENARVDADFSWTLSLDGNGSATCRWSASEPVGSGIDALAQGAQRVTARAAQAIARDLAARSAKAGAACRS